MRHPSEPTPPLTVHPLQWWYGYTRAQLEDRANLLVVSRSSSGGNEEWQFAHKHGDNLMFGAQRAWLRRQIEEGRLTAADAADPGKVAALGFASPGAPGFTSRTVSRGAVTQIIPEDAEAARRLLAPHCPPGEADYSAMFRMEQGLGLVVSP